MCASSWYVVGMENSTITKGTRVRLGREAGYLLRDEKGDFVEPYVRVKLPAGSLGVVIDISNAGFRGYDYTVKIDGTGELTVVSLDSLRLI